MKFIIIGLGTLGYSMARILTEKGDEVIGVDSNLSKVEEYKNSISTTICMDIRELHALSTLPIKDVDAVIVAIGNDLSTSIEVVAYVKQLGARKIYARSSSGVGTAILQAIGIEKIMNPSEYAAEIYSFDVQATPGIEGMYIIDKSYRIYQMIIPEALIGQKIEDVGFMENFKMQLVTVKRKSLQKNIFGQHITQFDVIPNLSANLVLEAEDQIILFGTIQDFTHMKKTLD